MTRENTGGADLPFGNEIRDRGARWIWLGIGRQEGAHSPLSL